MKTKDSFLYSIYLWFIYKKEVEKCIKELILLFSSSCLF